MKSQDGFTLIEAMIALVILAIGLTGVLRFSTFALKQADDNERWTQARFIAENQLDQRSSVSIDSLKTLADTTPAGNTTVEYEFETYTVDFWYQQTANQHYRITVRVSYPNAAFSPVTLSTEKNIFL